MRPMRGHCGLGLTPPPVFCELTKQGHRLISSIATAQDPSASIGLLRKFVASSSKHVALNTLSHLLSPSTYHPRLSSLAFPVSPLSLPHLYVSDFALPTIFADIGKFIFFPIKRKICQINENDHDSILVKEHFKRITNLARHWTLFIQLDCNHNTLTDFSCHCSIFLKYIIQIDKQI